MLVFPHFPSLYLLAATNIFFCFYGFVTQNILYTWNHIIEPWVVLCYFSCPYWLTVFWWGLYDRNFNVTGGIWGLCTYFALVTANSKHIYFPFICQGHPSFGELLFPIMQVGLIWTGLRDSWVRLSLTVALTNVQVTFCLLFWVYFLSSALFFAWVPRLSWKTCSDHSQRAIFLLVLSSSSPPQLSDVQRLLEASLAFFSQSDSNKFSNFFWINFYSFNPNNTRQCKYHLSRKDQQSRRKHK